MTGKRNRRWAKVPKGTKRAGCANASGETKTSAAPLPAHVSSAETTVVGRATASTSAGKAPNTSIRSATDTEEGSGQGNVTSTYATRPGVSYADALKAPIGGKAPHNTEALLREGGFVNENAPWAEDESVAEHAPWDEGESVNKNTDWGERVPEPEPFHPMGMSADPAKPDHQIPSFKKEQCVVCCIDLENNCFNQSREEARRGIRSKVPRTCEVGIALVDSRELSWDDKGDRWYKAWPAIYANSADFAIREHEHGPSHVWVWDCGQGRPENFLYGDPTWVGLAEIKSAVVGKIRAVLEKEDATKHKPATTCQKDEKTDNRRDSGVFSQNEEEVQARKTDTEHDSPTCALTEEEGQVNRDPGASEIQTQDKEENEAEDDLDASTKGPRHIVFVFFAGDGDLKWLRNLGIDLTEEFPNSSIVDLQRSFVAWKTAQVLKKSQCSFGDYMYALGLENPGAHNGGNDAVHGLQAFLAELALSSKQYDKLYGGGTLPMLVEEEQELESQTEVDNRDPGEVAQPAGEEAMRAAKDDATGATKNSGASAPVKEASAPW